MEEKKHSISISGGIYNDLKDYCNLNGLKLNEFAEKLLKDALMVEKYGDAPFFTVPKVGPMSEPINEPVKNEVVTLITPIEVDKPDSNGRVYAKEVVEKAIKKFNEEHPIPTPEKIGETAKEVLEDKKPKRKVTKLK